MEKQLVSEIDRYRLVRQRADEQRSGKR